MITVIDGILSCADNTDPRIPDRAQEPAEAPAAEISVTEHLAHNMSKWVIENQKLRDENHQLRDKNQELENEVIELRFKLGVRERHRGHEPRYLGAEETIMGYMQAGFESLISTQTAVHKSEEEELQPKEPARPDEHSVEEFETGDLIGEAEDIHGTS